jgi:predicted nucleotidyltransferase
MKTLAERVLSMDPATGNATICAEIGDQLAKIEDYYKVRILTAVESGSRAWGFASPDSDFDVRFLYVHHPGHYMTVWDQRDVIEWGVEDPSLDITGWDVKKALRLMARGNASVGEWLRSPLVYQWRFDLTADLQDLETKIDRRNYAWHYYGMAMGNFQKYLQGPEVSHKKYLYVLRPIAAANLVLRGQPLSTAMYPELPHHLPGVDSLVGGKVESLVRAKRQGDEMMIGPASEWLNAYVRQELDEIKLGLEGIPGESRHLDPIDVDTVFRAIVRDAWGES